MKRKIMVLSALLMTILLAACSRENDQNGQTSQSRETSNDRIANSDSEENSNQISGNILIAYFSVPETAGVDAVARASRVVEDGEVVGNTQFVAETIQQETGGEIFRIETVQEYPGDHDELVDFGENELAEDARPDLKNQIENLENYDTIFIGYPVWAGDLPMPLYTLLESTDFSGKTIIPFSTHGGSGFSGTISTLEDLQPDATVNTNGFTVSREDVSESREDIVQWVNSLSVKQ